MRIICFPKLIALEETNERALKSCSVVIDAQNYLHYKYEDSKIPFVFGCEANEYAKYLKNQINMFRKAGVKCYIVHKGGDTDITKKIEKYTTLDFDFDSAYRYVPPVFVKDVGVQVLDELRLDCTFCIAENKNECVALARKLKCPVVSNDIEYCFKNAPYISYKTMKFNSDTNSIQCREYNLEDFLNKNRLTKEKFAIFGTLSDTFLFPPNFFDALFQTWGVLNKDNNDYYIQNKQLIAWLSKHSEIEARKDIMETLSNDDEKNKFKMYYDNLLKNMQTDESGSLTDNLKNTIVRQDPKWFEKGVACNIISPIYINLYKWNVIEGSWAIEDKHPTDDSLLLSIDIIKYAYNLLKNYERGQIKLYSQKICTEIDTDDPNIKKPSLQCKVSVFENGWSYLTRLKLFEHFLRENNINIDVLSKVPVEATILFTALVYFARKKQLTKVDVRKEVYAVLLSFVMINVVFDKEGSFRKVNNDVIDADCKEAQTVTRKYFKCDKLGAKTIYDGTSAKRLVELQLCWLHMNYLNILCGSPYKPSKYSRMFNGTFAYKIFWEMQGQDCDVFMNDLFHSSPSVLSFAMKLIKIYEELLTKE